MSRPASEIASREMLDLSGTTLHGRYVLGRRIGVGAMGVVYEARHVSLGRRVAIKLLRGEHTQNGTFRSRFEREARAASRIRHRNVVDILDLGEIEGGPVYIVMELLEGEDMKAMLAREGLLAPERARALLLQVLGGIDAAHRVGIVHRDIKPANCVLVRDDDGKELLKVLDFGVAKLNDELASRELTGVSEVIGTISYLAPELTMGRSAHVGSDIYALGVMAFEMVMGAVPFPGNDMFEVMTRHLRQPPPPLGSHVPADLAAVIHRALAKEPADRWSGATQMIEALRGRVRRDDDDERPTEIRSRAQAEPPPRDRTMILAPSSGTAVPRTADRTAMAPDIDVTAPRFPPSIQRMTGPPPRDRTMVLDDAARPPASTPPRPPAGVFMPSVPLRSTGPALDKTEVLSSHAAPQPRERGSAPRPAPPRDRGSAPRPASTPQARAAIAIAIVLASLGILSVLTVTAWLLLR